MISRPKQFLTLTTSFKEFAGRQRKRIGRGMGGKGKTAGRGTKGYKARRAKATPTRGFEGGQAGIIKALPKIGPQTAKDTRIYTKLHLHTLEKLIQDKSLPSNNITMADLVKCGGMGKVRDGIILLGGGADKFSIKNLKIQVSKVSKSAFDSVAKNSGSVETIYTSKEKLEYFKNPSKFILPPTGLEIPSKTNDLEYYLSRKNGGYLAGLIPENTPRENILKELLLIRAQGLQGKKCQQ